MLGAGGGGKAAAPPSTPGLISIFPQVPQEHLVINTQYYCKIPRILHLATDKNAALHGELHSWNLKRIGSLLNNQTPPLF